MRVISCPRDLTELQDALFQRVLIESGMTTEIRSLKFANARFLMHAIELGMLVQAKLWQLLNVFSWIPLNESGMLMACKCDENEVCSAEFSC